MKAGGNAGFFVGWQSFNIFRSSIFTACPNGIMMRGSAPKMPEAQSLLNLVAGSIDQDRRHVFTPGGTVAITLQSTIAGGFSAEFIRRLPGGFEAQLGERGVTLSGGQRQRIAIARAVIRNTPILVLDEPTSGLDAASEQAVFEALGHLMEGRTSIVIAHHLATVRRANMIFVVKDNTLVERGTHDELLAAGGFYAELYEIQFRQEDLPAADPPKS